MLSREKFWRQAGEAFRGLDPEVVLHEAERPVSLALLAEDHEALRKLEEFFIPSELTPLKTQQVRERICSFLVPLGQSEEEGLKQLDLVVCSERAAGRIPHSLFARTYVLFDQHPESVIREILKDRWDLALPLAKNFLRFRAPVQRRWMRSIAMENALVAMAASIAEIAPAPLPLIRTVAGLRSVTTFITSNQLRLAFLMAAANDAHVGFREQSGQITAITAAALGWRTAARELAGRIDAGPRVAMKGLLAFAATYATGLALEQLHMLGRAMTREEKSAAYAEAYRVGRLVLDGILDRITSSTQSAA